GRAGEGVRVLAHVERAVDAVSPAVFADGLRNGQDVGLGEGALQRRAAVAAGAEGDALVRIGVIGAALVVLALELGRVDPQLFRGRLACQGRKCHGLTLSRRYFDSFALPLSSSLVIVPSGLTTTSSCFLSDVVSKTSK